MSNETGQSQSPSVVKHLIDLANEIDGIVDFGMVVCLLDEEKNAGRQQYIMQRCKQVQLTVDSIVSCIKKSSVLNTEQLSPLQSQLVTGSALLVNSYLSLRDFRSYSTELIRSATDAMQMGWESLHKSIREIAEKVGVFDPVWYDPILERQASYRNYVQQLFTWFHEATVASSSA